MYNILKILNKNILWCFNRLKPQNTEKVLQDYGNRARKLEGQKLDLDDFAHFLNMPVSDMLRDMFALFDEVSTLLAQPQLNLLFGTINRQNRKIFSMLLINNLHLFIREHIALVIICIP